VLCDLDGALCFSARTIETPSVDCPCGFSEAISFLIAAQQSDTDDRAITCFML
jgi:hypothetical protein